MPSNFLIFSKTGYDMPWIQLKINVNPDNVEEYEDLLLSLGSCAVTLEDAKDEPLFEPPLGTTPLWSSTELTGLFNAETDQELLVLGLETGHKELNPTTPLPKYKIEILEDKDWEREWMKNFHPIQFGSRLWVCPSWKPVPDPNAVNLMLDPGLAFGTGTHPTTALCLKWLDQQDCQDQLVIDYGCGSGILGIAALLLGATKTYGTDIDPQALTASRNNAERNQINENQLSLCYPEEMPALQADILVANILAGPLTELAPRLEQLIKSGGKIVLSGVLEKQAEALIETYQQWFNLDPIEIDDSWIRLTGTKR